MIDIGQGDSTLIITPRNKTILIDGGGSLSYDVGKNTLIPYLLDRKVKKLDYVIISHFDQDHVGGILSVLDKIEVKKVVIGVQGENSEQYKEFCKITKQRQVQVVVVKKGDIIHIERDVMIKILFPGDNLITKNVLNNNSLVAMLKYKDFKMLFTGDIEEVAEQQLIKMYPDNQLKADILKVAHHGSKTSSTYQFLELVKPKIALIGVGKDNKFGHPNDIVLERLKQYHIKVYRTDMEGEIVLESNGQNITKTMVFLP